MTPEYQLLMEIKHTLGTIEGSLEGVNRVFAIWKWVFGGTVLAGASWLSWLTLTLIGVL